MEVLQTRATILSLIKKVTEDYGIKDHKIVDVKTNQKGEGYLGEIFMVSVKDAKNGKKQEMVIKSAFIDEQIRNMFPIKATFENEIYFYTQVYPSYKKIEEELGTNDPLNCIPKCLKVYMKDSEEILILENLKYIGFEIFDKQQIFDDAHARLIFETYGKFHAYSYVLKDQRPEEYEKITKSLHNIYVEFTKNDFFEKHLMDVNRIVENMLTPGEDDEVIKRYSKYTGKNLVNTFCDLISKEIDHSAILHGDCWSNNMLFKYKMTANGKQPTEMRLIDFQLMKSGSPVFDLSYCLYSGGSKKIFDNLNEYLQIYYDNFSNVLKTFGSDPDKLLPFQVLKEHWKKYAVFGMIMSFQILKMKLTEKEDIVDLTDYDQFKDGDISELMSKMRFNEEAYGKRIRGLLWHLVEVDAL